MVIKDFDQLKKQLEDLHPIINAFKSEAVQLRIVDLIWGTASDEAEPNSSEREAPKPNRRTRRSRAKAAPKDASGSVNRAARSTRPGAATVLNDLIEEGFFDERRALKDIIEHSAAKKARRFKQSDFSGLLAKKVRDNALNREKNADGQFEYYK